jgi:hypothetical protein
MLGLGLGLRFDYLYLRLGLGFGFTILCYMMDMHYGAVLDQWKDASQAQEDESDLKVKVSDLQTSSEIQNILPDIRGRWYQRWLESKWSRIAFFCATIQTIIIISCEIVISILYFRSHVPRFTDVLLYLILFCFFQLFQFYFMLDAIRQKNTIQLIGYILMNAFLCVCSVLQLVQLYLNLPKDKEFIFDDVLPFLIVIISTLSIMTIALTWLIYAKLFLEFGWSIYRKIGTDPKYIQYFKRYQIAIMLIKLDILFFVCFSLQMIVLVLEPSNLEFSLTIAAIPLSLIFLVTAMYALNIESKIFMVLFLNGLAIGIAYFCFKTFRVYQTSQAFRYESSRIFLTFISAICLLITTLTFIYASLCLSYFGKGLKERIRARKEQDGQRILVL